MASDPGGDPPGAVRGGRDGSAGDHPAADGRSGYDYRGGGVERPELPADLRERVDGDVRFDAYSRQLYATDASLYEVTPVGVVFPASTADVAAVVSYCADEDVPVLPRGAGTSLAGQAVNEAVVLDFTRYMDDVLAVDPDERTARAQPGVVLAALNDELSPHGLKFAPDPAWGEKSTLGGAVGNNSSGAHSLRYGKTDAYVESCEVVLADGTVTTFGELPVEELRERAGESRRAGTAESSEGVDDPDGDLEARIHAEVARILEEDADAIEAAYPALKRNVSGYDLDWLVREARSAPERANGEAASGDAGGAERRAGESDAGGGTVNLAKLLCGSEGTLGIVTEVEVALEPVPETKAVALLAYEGLIDAVSDVAACLEHDPAAVELVDDVLIDLAADTAEFADVVASLPDGTRAALLVEFYAADDDAGRRKVADLLADRVPAFDPEAPPPGETDSAAPVRAFDAVEAHDAATRERVWSLRKSGLPILLSRTTDEKHVSFIEDCAVPPEHLPEYVEDFRAVLEAHGTDAAFYAHAGPGVLHVRPLIDAKTGEGVADMASIADGVTDLVVEYGGSVSGEHGDGRARTQWNRKLYGDEVWATFRSLKEAFDPEWLLNPGQVVGVDDAAVEAGEAPPRARTVDMTEHHRFGPDYEYDPDVEPVLEWGEGGMQGMVELCHGCGGCRGSQDAAGGVMCPTYRASEEEITTTRGRANALRAATSGDLPSELDDEFREEVLDLCVGCKGCARDCPSEVDVAKLKAELTHAHHRRAGVPLRSKLFANVDRLAAVASATAPVSNWLPELPGARRAIERTLGIARERSLPTFRRETALDRLRPREPVAAPGEADRRAILFVDTYTNYSHPEIAAAAVEVLEAAGVHVEVAGTDSGRPAFSQGLLDRAADRATAVVEQFGPRLDDGWDLVAVEPSDAVMFQSDYRDLLGADAAPVPGNAYGVCEYLDRFGLDEALALDAPDERLTYHGHCHQKAIKRDHHAVGVLRRAGYAVEPLDSGCCGMAGSFGYEADHYAMSRAIGRILFDQVDDAVGDVVVAPGTSCRTQLGDRDGASRPPHPVEKLADALP